MRHGLSLSAQTACIRIPWKSKQSPSTAIDFRTLETCLRIPTSWRKKKSSICIAFGGGRSKLLLDGRSPTTLLRCYRKGRCSRSDYSRSQAKHLRKQYRCTDPRLGRSDASGSLCIGGWQPNAEREREREKERGPSDQADLAGKGMIELAG